MEIKWLGTPEDRILSIRKFREYINTLPFVDAVRLTQKVWNGSPSIKANQFDFCDVADWPTPWELFSQPIYCIHSQVLGAYYTLVMSNHINAHSINLVITEDIIGGIKILIVIDDSPLTNYNVIATIKGTDVLKKLEK